MPKASPIRSTFNAGELSPLMEGRTDVAKYNNGCKVTENFIPSVQGPAVRRPGTRFVSEVKDSTDRTWLLSFQFNITQSYILEFGDFYIRFYTNHGQVLSAGVPYEVVSPYAIADLTNSDGCFNLGYVQSGDIIYLTHPNYPVYKLSRISNINWTIKEAEFLNGPFDDKNIDKAITVSASATKGNVTITSSAPIFNANHVGALFYMEPSDLSAIKPWYAGQEFTANPFGEYRRSDSKTYICKTSGTPTAGKVWRTGASKPIHLSGIAADGDGSSRTGTVVEREGLDWQFVDVGYGYVKITSYVNANQVNATVVGDYPLPKGVVGATYGASKVITVLADNGSNLTRITAVGHGLTSGNSVNVSIAYTKSGGSAGSITGTYEATVITANTFDVDIDWAKLDFGSFGSGLCNSVTAPYITSRWAFGAFSKDLGYPENVTFFRERLTFSKGTKLYFSVSGDFENFAAKDDTNQVVADRAIQIQLSSDHVDSIEWIIPSQALLIGTASQEFACSENSNSQAFAPANVKIEQQTSEGSRGVYPIAVGFSTLFVQRSGRKLKELAYNIQQNGYVSADMTVLSEHITQGGIVSMDWHQEPYVALWAARTDGMLLGFTFNKEQDVVGWHRHPIGGSGIVECVCVIPNPDKSRDDLWMIVRRTINGSTKRYIEYLEREYRQGDDQADAFYVDSGLTYSGSPATIISGLNHLEGKTVQVLADGAAHPDCVVTSGAITLSRSASKVQIGLACPATIQSTRIEAGAGDGTAQGKTKRINKVVMRFYNTLGGFAGPDTSNLDEINFRTGSDLMDHAPPLFTGDKLIEWPDGYNFDGYVTYQQQQPFPATLIAVMPQLHTFDR